jgi:hypothetical protein
VLAKASKAVQSFQETPLSIESISESPEVLKIHSTFMIYLRIGGLSEDKDEHE